VVLDNEARSNNGTQGPPYASKLMFLGDHNLKTRVKSNDAKIPDLVQASFSLNKEVDL